MSCISIRGCRIGEGRPKIIIPIVERTEADILARAAAFSTLDADFVEWRADWYEHCLDSAALTALLRRLRCALGEMPLLVTLRSKAEGGMLDLSSAEYAAFLDTVAASGCADLIDIELFPAGAELPSFIARCHAAGLPVICSSHDFAKTPPQAEMTARLCAMREAGADILKLAVMPNTPEDVLALLSATAAMRHLCPDAPVVTMSMGALGAVSRLSGEAFGSAMTFASAGKASAPGQIALDTLRGVLSSLAIPSAD